MKYILSYGGGLNSTALLVHLIKNKMPLDLVLFADTGNEFPRTYKTVQFYKKYSEDNGINFVTVNSKYGKDLYDYCYDKKITPSRIKRDCTSKFKIEPMRYYLRSIYDKNEKFTRYIGISLEESHRMRDSDRSYEINAYPLVDAKIDREGCSRLLESEGLPVPEKSGCYFCPFTKKDNWIKMLKEDPLLFEKAMKLEQNSNRYPEYGFTLSSQPLIKIKNRIVNQTTLLDFEPNCDIVGSCFL